MRKIIFSLATCLTATCRRRGWFHKLLGSPSLPVLCALPCGGAIHVVGIIRLFSVNSFCVVMLWPRGSQILTQVGCNCTCDSATSTALVSLASASGMQLLCVRIASGITETVHPAAAVSSRGTKKSCIVFHHVGIVTLMCFYGCCSNVVSGDTRFLVLSASTRMPSKWQVG